MYQVRDFEDALNAIGQAHVDEVEEREEAIADLEGRISDLEENVAELEDELAEMRE